MLVHVKLGMLVYVKPAPSSLWLWLTSTLWTKLLQQGGRA